MLIRFSTSCFGWELRFIRSVLKILFCTSLVFGTFGCGGRALESDNSHTSNAPLELYGRSFSREKLTHTHSVERLFTTEPATVTQLIHLLRIADRLEDETDRRADVLALLLDNNRIASTFGKNSALYFVDPFGTLRVRRQSDLNETGEAHFCQLLGAFAESRVPLDTPISVSSTASFSVGDLLKSSESNLMLAEEVEWFVIAHSLYAPAKSKFVNRLGDEITRSDLIKRLVDPPLTSGACAGAHRLYALAVLLQVDVKNQVLNGDDRATILSRLSNAADAVSSSQTGFGGWSRRWGPQSNVAAGMPLGENSLEQYVHMTGHHLEWLVLFRSKEQSHAEACASAFKFIDSAVEHFSDEQVRRNYCGISHGAAASLLVMRPTQ